MTTLTIPLSAASLWQTALSSYQSSGFHHHAFCQMQSMAHQQSVSLYVQSDCLLAPLVHRPWHDAYDVCNPYGYSGLVGDTAALPALYDYLKQDGCIALYSLQHPVLSPLSQDHADCFYAHTAYVIDLQRSLRNIHANLSSNHRRNLKKCSDKDYEIITDKSELTEPFIQHYRHFLKHIDAASVYDFTPDSLRYIISSERCQLIGIRTESGIEAVLSFLIGDNGAEFFLQGATPSGRGYARLILWEAVRSFSERGYSFLNLGGGVRDGDSLSEFKRQFASRAVACYAIKKVINPALYAKHSKTVDRNYFPAYRASTP